MKPIFILLAIAFSAPTHARQVVVCSCFVDYGLSFENLGSITFDTNLNPSSPKFADFADKACAKKYNNAGARAINCSTGN